MDSSSLAAHTMGAAALALGVAVAAAGRGCGAGLGDGEELIETAVRAVLPKTVPGLLAVAVAAVLLGVKVGRL